MDQTVIRACDMNRDGLYLADLHVHSDGTIETVKGCHVVFSDVKKQAASIGFSLSQVDMGLQLAAQSASAFGMAVKTQRRPRLDRRVSRG